MNQKQLVSILTDLHQILSDYEPMPAIDNESLVSYYCKCGDLAVELHDNQLCVNIDSHMPLAIRWALAHCCDIHDLELCELGDPRQ